jgi:hypothetical protein
MPLLCALSTSWERIRINREAAANQPLPLINREAGWIRDIQLFDSLVFSAPSAVNPELFPLAPDWP